jgi:hypothetical protein
VTNADVVQVATGRSSIEDALAWIAEGHTLKDEIGMQVLLQAVVGLGGCGENHQAALRRVARAAVESDLDTANAIYNPDLLGPLRNYKAILDLLARKSPTRTLHGLTPEAVGAAQHEDPLTMEVFSAIAGLSFRDLKERIGDEIPNKSRGRWRAGAIAAAFSVVDGIVRGTEKAKLAEGAIALRPVELLLNGDSSGGWAAIENMRVSGVPYEWLLAQRTVGSAWGSHRNRTSSKPLEVVASNLCEELDRLRVKYRRSTSVGGSIRPSELRRLAGGGSHIGVVALARSGTARFGVAFSIARDGGTVRKSAGRLQAMAARAHVPVAVVVAGPGWSLRNETADMAAAFAGRVYSDRTVRLLAQHIHDHIIIGHVEDV